MIGYEFTPKLSASLGAQYFDGVVHEWGDDLAGDPSVIRAGLTVDYEIVENFASKLAVVYTDLDSDNFEEEDNWSGFVRFQRNF